MQCSQNTLSASRTLSHFHGVPWAIARLAAYGRQ